MAAQQHGDGRIHRRPLIQSGELLELDLELLGLGTQFGEHRQRIGNGCRIVEVLPDQPKHEMTMGGTPCVEVDVHCGFVQPAAGGLELRRLKVALTKSKQGLHPGAVGLRVATRRSSSPFWRRTSACGV